MSRSVEIQDGVASPCIMSVCDVPLLTPMYGCTKFLKNLINRAGWNAGDDFVQLPIPGRPAQKCNSKKKITEQKKKKHIILIP
jgi:hypothetical protein